MPCISKDTLQGGSSHRAEAFETRAHAAPWAVLCRPAASQAAQQASIPEEQHNDAPAHIDSRGPPGRGGRISEWVQTAGGPLTFETGRLAPQADSAVTATLGQTCVLAAIVAEPMRADRVQRTARHLTGLKVSYRERMAAVGRMPNTMTRNEQGENIREAGTADAVESALQALLPPGIASPMQVSLSVLSSDAAVDPDTLAINAASAALAASDVPCAGPAGAVRVASVRGRLAVSAKASAAEEADLDLLYVGTADRALFVELQGRDAQLETVRQALALAQRTVGLLLQPQARLAGRVRRSTRQVPLLGADPVAAAAVAGHARPLVDAVLRGDTEAADPNPIGSAASRTPWEASGGEDPGDVGGGDAGPPSGRTLWRALEGARAAVEARLVATGMWRTVHARVAGSGCVSPGDLEAAWPDVVADAVRALVLNECVRPDGRGLRDLRPLRIEALPATTAHGTAVLAAGDTQVLASATVGTMNDVRSIHTLMGEGSTRLISAFACPGFATSVVDPRWRSARGEALASARLGGALEGALPAAANFPFPLRVTADALSADGSTVATAITAGSLALDAAGVPAFQRVAGATVAILMENAPRGVGGSAGGPVSAGGMPWVQPLGRWELLADPSALEEASASAQVTMAASERGLLSAHLEVDLPGGLPLDVLDAALEGAFDACQQHIAALEVTLPEGAHSSVAEEDSEGTGFSAVVDVPGNLAGRVIGPGGANLRAIEAQFGARISVDKPIGLPAHFTSADTARLKGTVRDNVRAHIFAPTRAALDSTRQRLLDEMGESIKVGQRYNVTVSKVLDFGAFVQFDNGYKALLHISEISPTRMRAVEDELHDYAKGDKVVLKVNKLTSIKTQLPYEYYSMPYCRPEKIMPSAENLGEVLRGDRIENSPYEIAIRNDENCKVLCKIDALSENQAKAFRGKIEDEYRVLMILDNLPIAIARVREENGVRVKTYERGFPVGRTEEDGRVLLHNHLRFTILYHRDAETDLSRIVGFEVEPFSVKHKYDGKYNADRPELKTCSPGATKFVSETDEKQEVKEKEEIVFTYDVSFKPSEIRWASRWDTYLMMLDDQQIHWFSIINSLMIVLFLSGMVAMIMMRTLHRDISKYNQLETAEEAQEETGWKLVHGDVFRAPAAASLLSVYAGTGAQLLACAGVTMIFAVLGFLSPANRGGLMTATLLLFVFMGLFAGYASARLYKTFKGEQWKKTTLTTALLYPGVVFSIFFACNLLVWGQKSSGAVPFGTLFALFMLWFGISVPLVFVGSYFGYKKPAPDDPVRTNKIPRQIPEQAWYMNPLFSVLIGGILPFGAVFIELFFILTSMWLHQFYYLFGFLCLVFVILIITCAEITIVLCYFQLCSEDYHWWWRSFFTSGSSALYLFLYSAFYFYTKLDITKVVPAILYFSYMAIVSYSFFCLTGAVGFYACYIFVRKIYSAVKID
ncbi:hypothetical protein WJX81_000620 [Elliptochloris bilobata]|uniref:Polynucleotide phosphorylase 1 n=1 Tax=Elliptochloris bilobata TaxID=381761 RepID=A0AAW1QWQ3_9CHLO